MSKNIEEIVEGFVLNEVLKGLEPNWISFNAKCGYDIARLHLKQALTEGKLIINPDYPFDKNPTDRI